MKKSAIDRLTVGDMLRQQPPFVVVDSMTECGYTALRSRFTVTADSLFVSDGRLISEGLLENICQTAALRMGYSRLMSEENAGEGFIGAIRDFRVYRNPVIGTTVETTVEISHSALGMIQLYGKVYDTVDGMALADGYVTVVIRDKKP